MLHETLLYNFANTLCCEHVKYNFPNHCHLDNFCIDIGVNLKPKQLCLFKKLISTPNETITLNQRWRLGHATHAIAWGPEIEATAQPIVLHNLLRRAPEGEGEVSLC